MLGVGAISRKTRFANPSYLKCLPAGRQATAFSLSKTSTERASFPSYLFCFGTCLPAGRNPKQKNRFSRLRCAEPGEDKMGNFKCQAGFRLLANRMRWDITAVHWIGLFLRLLPPTHITRMSLDRRIHNASSERSIRCLSSMNPPIQRPSPLTISSKESQSEGFSVSKIASGCEKKRMRVNRLLPMPRETQHAIFIKR